MGKKSKKRGQVPLDSVGRAVLQHVENATRQLNHLYGVWRSSQGDITSEFVVIRDGSWTLHLTTTERNQTVGYTVLSVPPTETEEVIDRTCREGLEAGGYTNIIHLTRDQALRELAS